MKFETETIHTVDFYDFESYVKSVYGIDPEVILSLESTNDTSHEFYVQSVPLDEWDREQFENWLNGGPGTIYPGIILNRLASDGSIPAGHWIIRVSW